MCINRYPMDTANPNPAQDIIVCIFFKNNVNTQTYRTTFYVGTVLVQYRIYLRMAHILLKL